MAVSIDSIADRSPLITDELEEQMSGLFASLERQVTVTSIIDDDENSENNEKSLEMAVFLKHMTGLSDRLTLRLIGKGSERDADSALDSSFLPATGFHTEDGYARTVFHGVPGGHELGGFISALLAAGGHIKQIDGPTHKEIAGIKKKTLLHIAVSLGCSHCAATVINAQRIAEENELVTVHTIDANLYPELVKEYRIERVPLLTIDGEIVGQTEMTLPELCRVMRDHKPGRKE